MERRQKQLSKLLSAGSDDTAAQPLHTAAPIVIYASPADATPRPVFPVAGYGSAAISGYGSGATSGYGAASTSGYHPNAYNSGLTGYGSEKTLSESAGQPVAGGDTNNH